MTTSSTNLAIQLPEDESFKVHDPLLGPPCLLCGGVSRLIGIEPHPRDDRTDLRTFECVNCNHPFTVEVPLNGGMNGK